MRTKDVDMLSGPIMKGLWAIAAPVMIMNVINSLFNIVDMTVLKTFDTVGMAVGSVGVCNALTALATLFITGLASGANVVIATYLGKREQDRAHRSVGTGVAFALFAGLLLAAAGVSLAGTVLGWMNCPPELFAGATLYLRLYFAGIPALMLYQFAASALRSCGDSRTPMVISISGATVKICASMTMVAVFRMGVLGVALATILCWAVMAVWGLICLIRTQSSVRLYPQHIRFYAPELPRILRIGVPAGLQMALANLANVVITTAVNGFGAQAATGVSIANTYDGLLYNICTATAIAVMPYVSQNVGAGNVRRADRSVWEGTLLTAGIGIFFGLLSAFFAVPLSSIMSSDPVVIDFSRQKMIIISSTYFLCGINDIFSGALRGMGHPTFPTVATLVFMCGMRIFWVYAIFPLFPNLTFLYLVWPVSWVACILCALPVYSHTKRFLEAHYADRAPARNRA